MTYSPLALRVLPSPKSDDRKDNPITRILIRTAAEGSNESIEDNLAFGDNHESANYVARTDGSLTGIVPEERSSWFPQGVDLAAITVMAVVVTTPDSIAMSERTTDMLAHLLAQTSLRRGWGPIIRGNNLLGDSPVLTDEVLDDLAAKANTILGKDT